WLRIDDQFEDIEQFSSIPPGKPQQGLSFLELYFLRPKDGIRLYRPLQECNEIFLAKGIQDIDLTPGQKGRNHLKAGVLRGRPNQGDPSLFHGPQKGILLGFAEAMDFVNKEYGVFCGKETSTLLGLFNDFPDLF